MRTRLVALLAAGLVAALPAATAAETRSPAAPLSLEGARAGAELQRPRPMAGDTLLFVGLAALAILAFVLVFIDDDGEPESP